MLDTMVLSLEKGCICAVSPQKGMFEVKAKAIVLAMGCRERPRGALNIPGFRPAGIYSAIHQYSKGDYAVVTASFFGSSNTLR